LCAIYFCIAPFIYAIIRIQEPAVIPALKKSFCRRVNGSESGSSIGDSDVLRDQLDGFLTSSLNVELVYVILTGICKSVNQEDLESFKNGHIPTGAQNDFSLRINIDKIEIYDFKMWEDSRQQAFIIDENCPVETNLDSLMLKQADGTNKLTIEKTVTVDAFFVNSFAKLRAQDGIEIEDILDSLMPNYNRSNVFKAGEASGASGSFFFFSHDKRFVIKTMTKTEKDFFFSKFGRNYFQHLKSNPSSFIAKIYGIYTVKMKGHAPIYLMMLAHTLKIEQSDKI
jgi:hypothetical protein